MSETSYDLQVKETELDLPDSWEEDPRDKFIKQFSPLIEGSDFYFVKNVTDSNGKLLELYKNGVKKRVLVFKGKQNMTIGAAFNKEFYQFIKQTINLPENRRPNKTQPHIDISLKTLWNVICVATGKQQCIWRPASAAFAELNGRVA